MMRSFLLVSLLIALPAPASAAHHHRFDSVAGGVDAPHKGPGEIRYRPGRWISFRATERTQLRLRLMLQPMARYGHASTQSDDSVDMIIRRGRLGMQADLPHDLGLRFEISVKNMHYEIHNMFGRWQASPDLAVEAGFIKAPGGLERDTFSFDQPFIERSVVTFLNYDHEMGVKVAGRFGGALYHWAASITRNPPQLTGGDPEDSPQMPTGVESEDITRAASKWNAAARFGIVPGRDFEASMRVGLRFRPDEADFGEIAVEPYDTTYLTNRPWHGVWLSLSGDTAIVQPHWKLVAEGGFRRDGQQLEYPDGTIDSEREVDGGHLLATVGYLVLGFTPDGHYGHAADAAPLRCGWELVTRLNATRVKPVDQGAATFFSTEVGLHWEASPQLRLQADVAYEVFGKNDHTLLDENRDGRRIWAQVWATLRL